MATLEATDSPSTVEEALAFWKISKSLFWRLVAEKRIRLIRIGSKPMVARDELRRIARVGTTTTASARKRRQRKRKRELLAN